MQITIKFLPAKLILNKQIILAVNMVMQYIITCSNHTALLITIATTLYSMMSFFALHHSPSQVSFLYIREG